MSISAWDYWGDQPKKATMSLKEQRLSICRECPLFDADEEVCQKCGCFMPEYTEYLSNECPVHKW